MHLNALDKLAKSYMFVDQMVEIYHSSWDVSAAETSESSYYNPLLTEEEISSQRKRNDLLTAA